MYATLDVDERNRASELPGMITEQVVDGVLVLGAFLEATITYIGRQFMQPVVLVDANAPGHAFDSIIINNVDGAQSAVEYLIAQGHRHIGLIGSALDAYPSIRERRKGYTRALREHDIPHTYIEDGELTRESGYDSTMRLLQRCPQITGLFCCNDQVAVAAMSAIHDMNLRVPDDISVIGFDDIDLAQEVSPTLTTIHVDKVLMGALAVRQLMDRANHPERAALTTSLSTTLIVRESVGEPRL